MNTTSLRALSRRRAFLLGTILSAALVAGTVACGSDDAAAPDADPSTNTSPDGDGDGNGNGDASTPSGKGDAASDAGSKADGATPGDGDGGGDAASDAGESPDAATPPPPGTKHKTRLMAAGDQHTCALLDDHSVKCWGDNYDGHLGLGDATNRGDKPGQMGDNLPAVKLGTGRTALSLAVGWDHTCALLDDHSVKCWGDNSDGQLGLGNTTTRGAHAGHMGDNLPAVDLGTGRTALSLAAGDNYTCALLDDHSVKCWGDNYDGQLGLGDTTRRGDKPGQTGDNLPTVDLGTGRTALSVAAGADHTCALLDDHSLKCWGFNYNGHLGLGDTTSRGDKPGQMGDNLPTVDLGTWK